MEAYKRSPEDKAISSALCEICIRLDDLTEAEEYYKGFVELAPEDANCFVLKYKLAAANKVDVKERIAILEELKEKKRSAKWLYELAKLYLMAEMPEKCKKQCEEIFESFGESRYAAKAMDLKNKVG